MGKKTRHFKGRFSSAGNAHTKEVTLYDETTGQPIGTMRRKLADKMNIASTSGAFGHLGTGKRRGP